MNYEEKYKEMKKRVLAIGQGYVKEVDYSSPRSIAEYIDPELRESEDERIRKSLIVLIKEIKLQPLKRLEDWNGMLAWLEKQKEIKTKDFGEFINELSKQFPEISFAKLSRIAVRVKNWLEKQGEEKPTDKDEPKFKVGEWIINNDKRIAVPTQVLEIEKYGYVTSRGYISFNKVKTDYHLWTIQDANDGDVLATKKGNPFIYDKDRYNNGLAYYYAGLDVNKELTLKSPHHMLAHFGELHSVSPATKEQRELLFQKMKEAGYEWNAEKKELNKIEQKPSWSEEDEKIRRELYDFITCQYGSIDDMHYYSWISWITKEPVEQDTEVRDLWVYIKEWREKFGILPKDEDELAACIGYVMKRHKESKQEWSEYDKIQLSEAIQMIEANGTWIRSEDAVKKVSNWLKSLKDKTQPKQEWSEKDKNMLESIIDCIDGLCFIDSDQLNWLKSLKPNHWRPSEEQMNELRKVAFQFGNSCLSPYSDENKELVSLYNDLKKL